MKTKAPFLLAILWFSTAVMLLSQEHTATYFLRNTPNTYRLNPAKLSTGKFYISLPVVSRFDFTADLGYISLRDALQKDPNRGDSLVISLDKLVSKMGENGQIHTGFHTTILGFGFDVSRHNFSFALDWNTYAAIPYSRDLFLLFSRGNADFVGQTMELFRKGDQLELSSYLAAIAGYSTEIIPGLNVGVRLKYLMGLANLQLKNTQVALHTDPSDYSLTAIGKIYGQTASIIAIPLIQELTNDTTEHPTTPSVEDLFRNAGFAFDLGGVYAINETMKVSAGLADVGFIRWKSHTSEFRSTRSEANYTYSGVAIDPGNMNTIGTTVASILDTLKERFQVESAPTESYSTALPSKYYGAFEWQCLPVMSLDALLKFEILPTGRLDYGLSLFPHLKIGKWFDLIVGNTFARGHFFCPTVAINLNGGGNGFYLAATVNNSLHVTGMEKIALSFGAFMMFGRR